MSIKCPRCSSPTVTFIFSPRDLLDSWSCSDCQYCWIEPKNLIETVDAPTPTMPSKPEPSTVHFKGTNAFRRLLASARPQTPHFPDVDLSTPDAVQKARANFLEILRLGMTHPDVPFYQAAMHGAVNALFDAILATTPEPPK